MVVFAIVRSLAASPDGVRLPSGTRAQEVGPSVNPYLATAIAMCVIVLLSLAGTAYLAAVFNRRAKSDMQARLDPLAAAIDGVVDVEEARVEGRFHGQIAIGRVANAPGGFGRLFHVELVPRRNACCF